jgi:hypothetical protein
VGALPIGPVADWPQPVEVARLEGHKRDINFMLFDAEGHRVATGAKDGQVKVGSTNTCACGACNSCG